MNFAVNLNITTKRISGVRNNIFNLMISKNNCKIFSDLPSAKYKSLCMRYNTTRLKCFSLQHEIIVYVSKAFTEAM